MPATTPAICPACGARDNFRLAGQPEDYEYRVATDRPFHIRQCGGCGSRFVWPRPGVDELTAMYPDDYHAYNEDHGLVAGVLVARRDAARQRRYLELTSSRPVRLFDVGSGDCRQFDALRDSGLFEFGGVELNPGMVAKARAGGYDVHQGTLEDMDIGPHLGTYDIVTMYQLVEHVLEPGVLFEKALRLLRPGGVVLGQLPCLDSLEAKVFGKYWAGYHFPRHLQQFTRHGLSGCMQNAGFMDVRVKTALHLQAAISLQNWIVDRFPPRQRLRYGKLPVYSGLLLAVAPFCILEYLLGQGGMMDFSARKPS